MPSDVAESQQGCHPGTGLQILQLLLVKGRAWHRLGICILRVHRGFRHINWLLWRPPRRLCLKGIDIHLFWFTLPIDGFTFLNGINIHLLWFFTFRRSFTPFLCFFLRHLSRCKRRHFHCLRQCVSLQIFRPPHRLDRLDRLGHGVDLLNSSPAPGKGKGWKQVPAQEHRHFIIQLDQSHGIFEAQLQVAQQAFTGGHRCTCSLWQTRLTTSRKDAQQLRHLQGFAQVAAARIGHGVAQLQWKFQLLPLGNLVDLFGHESFCEADTYLQTHLVDCILGAEDALRAGENDGTHRSLDSECQAFLLCCSDLLRDVADQHLRQGLI
mmetsp:Transcript_44790/g.97347  ORF Transcript_44790/g.97347 Transcript_44790/m.97347 type:complete len:323 (+) Transcript_44790:572-1540(+)